MPTAHNRSDTGSNPVWRTISKGNRHDTDGTSMNIFAHNELIESSLNLPVISFEENP